MSVTLCSQAVLNPTPVTLIKPIPDIFCHNCEAITNGWSANFSRQMQNCDYCINCSNCLLASLTEESSLSYVTLSDIFSIVSNSQVDWYEEDAPGRFRGLGSRTNGLTFGHDFLLKLPRMSPPLKLQWTSQLSRHSRFCCTFACRLLRVLRSKWTYVKDFLRGNCSLSWHTIKRILTLPAVISLIVDSNGKLIIDRPRYAFWILFIALFGTPLRLNCFLRGTQISCRDITSSESVH